jgi:hypothetical protein
MDPWVHWRAIHHYRCVAMCSHLMTQLHFRQLRQLNQIYLQNCYILHRRGMATARASRQTQATRQERIVPTPPVPVPAPSPTVEVAVFSVEPGEENTLAAPKTPLFTATKPKVIFGLSSLPARCPAVTWSSDLSDDRLDNVSHIAQPSDNEGYEGDEDDIYHSDSDDDHVTKAQAQDWQDPNSAPDRDQPCHPNGSYDRDNVGDVDGSKDFYADTDDGRRRLLAMRSAYEKSLGPDVFSFPRQTRGFYESWAKTTTAHIKYPDSDSPEDDDKDDPYLPCPAPLSNAERLLQNLRAVRAIMQAPMPVTDSELRLRRAYEKIQYRRFGTTLHTHHTQEFYGDWAWARTQCNGTDYTKDHPDYCFDTDYKTDYDSDLQCFLGSDCEVDDRCYPNLVT